MSRKKIDHSGETINGVKINYRIEDYIPPGGGRPLARYNCSCVHCNKTFNSLYAEVKSKKKDGCGCKNGPIEKPNKRRNVEGQRFGHCIAVKRLENGYWACQCDCGKTFTTSLSHLTTGHTKSCGCYRVLNTHNMKVKDLAGKKINMLTVEKYMYSKRFTCGDTAAMWLCECECGSKTIVSTGELVSGGTKSCGCLAASKRELLIREWLKAHKIMFATEYKFADLHLKALLRYDFAVFNSNQELLGLIEHHGVQHYVDNSTIHFGEQQREITDEMKRQYCKEHNIPLYIIKYTEDIDESLNKIIAELHANTVPSL